MFWNYSKKSSQSGTLFLKVYIIQTDLACSFVMYFVMCVAGWSDLGYSVSMQTSCTVITICDICESIVCPSGESDYCKGCMSLPTEAQVAKLSELQVPERNISKQFPKPRLQRLTLEKAGAASSSIMVCNFLQFTKWQVPSYDIACFHNGLNGLAQGIFLGLLKGFSRL